MNLETAFTAQLLNSKAPWNFAAGIQITSGDWSVAVGGRRIQTCLTLEQSGSCKEVSWSSPLLQAVSTKVDGVAGDLWLPAGVCRGAATSIWAPDVSPGTCQQDCHRAGISDFLIATPCKSGLLGPWGHFWRLLCEEHPAYLTPLGCFLYGPNTKSCTDIKECLCVSSAACVGVQVEYYSHRPSHEGNGDIYLGHGSFVTSWLHSVLVLYMNDQTCLWWERKM